MKKIQLTAFQTILLSFAAVILAGAGLLCLPVAARDRVWTPFPDALFTATSAVCVTGLVVRDTASYWSGFGQAVLLGLIQVGGLGVITVATLVVKVSGRRINLRQRSTLQEAAAAPTLGGIVRFTGFALRVTLLAEAVGAAALAPCFVPKWGWRGVWMAVFHAVSAFCNAGFDLMGTPAAPFVSLTGWQSSWGVNLVIMALIVAGGLGFFTWQDLALHRHHVRRWRMQTKVILSTTGILILLPAALFYLFDFADLPGSSRALAALFQSVTARTAGFNTAALDRMTGAGRTLMIALMLVGGSPGSTAGGMKTTTLAVLLAGAAAVYRRREDAGFFGRRLGHDALRAAAAILVLYLSMLVLGASVMSTVEGIAMGPCLFEAASAIGTVGLSLGLTPTLGAVSRGVLILLMFFGRVGALTLVYAALSAPVPSGARLPEEHITVG